MQLPVFYRDSLATVLTLEKLRNLIETNIDAGITLYTDHKPALFENSLSNKGQLSAWKLAEVADLMSIVERIYRQGTGMLMADPLSRVCAPTEGWYDPTLPRKLAALLNHLTDEIKHAEHIRLYCYQDTIAAARIMQRWRTPKNKVATGRLTQEPKKDAFLIGTPTANSVIKEVLQLLEQNRSFAVLMPLSLVPELSRLENKGDIRAYDQHIAQKVQALSKIVLSSSAQVWLISLANLTITKVLTEPEEGAGPEAVGLIFRESLANLFELMEVEDDWQERNNLIAEMLPLTRSRKRAMGDSDDQSESILSPAHGLGKQLVTPTIERGKLSWKRLPREPLPSLPPLDQWSGIQLDHDNLPARYSHEPPKGELIANIPGRPCDLLGIPNHLCERYEHEIDYRLWDIVSSKSL
jgi:hypothetical protein